MRTFFFQRALKFSEKPLGFPFQMDSGNVTKLHLDDNWVSNGLNVAPQKPYENNEKSTYWCIATKIMINYRQDFNQT